MSVPRVAITALTVALLPFALASPPRANTTTSQTFQASADFSGTQGHRGWSYRDSAGALMTYDSAARAWHAKEGGIAIWPSGAHPGGYHGALRRWTAPQAGTIRITGIAADNDATCGDGVIVTIRRHGTDLWQKTLANGNTGGLTFDLTTSVAAGSSIDFLVTRGPRDNHCDSTQFDAIIGLGTSASSSGGIQTPTGSTGSTTTNPPTGPSTTPLPAPLPEPPDTHGPVVEGPVVSSWLFASILGPWTRRDVTDPVGTDAWSVIDGKPLTFLFTEVPQDADPDAPNAYGWGGPSFYDRAWWCYGHAAATARADVLKRCRFYAREVADQPRFRNIETYVRSGDYTTAGLRPSGRDMPVMGLALAAADPHDPGTQAIAKRGMARAAYNALGWATYRDPRESGYSLMALVFSHALGAGAQPSVLVADLPPRTGEPWTRTRARNWNSAAEALKALNSMLAAQQPWGCWADAFQGSTGATPIYMQGILLEALAYYDDLIGDPRIQPAILKCLAWLKREYEPTPPRNGDNRFGTGGWWYSVNSTGTAPVNSNVYPTLSMLLLNSLAWAYEKTGDPQWYALAEAAFASSVRDNADGSRIFGSKEANQYGRGLFRWLAVR